MATGTTLINGALQALQAISEGGSHNTSQGTFGLSVLNRMLDRMSVERLTVFQVKEEDLSWPGATASRTIGASGNFNTTWPSRVEAAVYVGSDTYAWPIAVGIDRRQYELVVDKALAGEPPELLFFDRAFPLGTLYIWPIPASAWTLRLSSWARLASIAAVGDTVNLPPGYEDMLVWNLAKALWPTYPTEQTRDFIMSMARESLTSVKSLNGVPVPLMRLPPEIGGAGRYNIYQDR